MWSTPQESSQTLTKSLPSSRYGHRRRIKFAPRLADITKPLVKDSQWVWDKPQQRAVDEIKEILVTSPVLALFDVNLETILSVDTSSYGLGAVLLQRQKTGEFKPVAYISRSMSPNEQRYMQIEKEALASMWACERLSRYLIGLKFHIHTAHNPLVPLFGSKHLDELPARVQRFRLRMMRFDFTISHVHGKDLLIADTLSRAPTIDPGPVDQLLQEEADAYMSTVVQSLPATERRLLEIKRLQDEDKTFQKIVESTQESWPDNRAVDAGSVEITDYKMREKVKKVDTLTIVLYRAEPLLPYLRYT